MTAHALALALHVVRYGDDLDAWWEDENGDWVRDVEIGLA